ncbi:MAG: c-type cytochrome [Nitrospinota bacterium]
MEEEPDKKIRLLADYIMTIGPRPFSANFDRARRKYPDVDARAGAQLVRELNCAGCHRLSGVPAARKIAPVLSNAGSKFRRDWLVSFIRKPYTLRPAGYVLSWRSRMPGFRLTEKESSAIADYLMSLTTLDLAGNFRDEGRMSRRQRYRGRKMFKKIYGCVGCHRIKGRRGKIEGGLSGPDLSGAGDRLQPAFIYQFIRDPRAFEPEGKMPVFGHYLPEKDARFLTRYLLRMP